MDKTDGSNTQSLGIGGALLAYRFINNARRKSIDKDEHGKKLNPREQIFELNKKIEINKNIVNGQKSRNWDIIKQKITTAKISDALSVLKYEVNGKKVNVLRPLGEGGYSQVYEVYDKKKTIFALKTVNLQNQTERAQKDLIKEIVFLEKLKNCSGVVKAFEYELKETEDSHWMYVLMEKGDMDLFQILARSRETDSLTPSKLRFYWEQMLQAVRDVHSLNIIHADIKPGNFLMVAGQLKLIDFGLAMEQIPGQEYVQKKNIIGTREFMSPEVLAGYVIENGEVDREAMMESEGVKYTKMVDIWALGIILYNIVYGTQPFCNVPGGKYARIKAISSLEHPVEFPAVDNMDPTLLDTLKKCLQKDPEKRSSAAQLLDHPYLRPSSFPVIDTGPRVCPSCLTTRKAMSRIATMRNSRNSSSLLC